MIGVCLVFWSVAVRNPDPLVVEDAWAAGVRASEELRERGEAGARGLDLHLEARPEGEGLRVRVTAVDREGARVTAERVMVRRERPAEGGLDAEFSLRDEDGAFVGSLPLPRPGRWRLAVTATVAGRPVRRDFAFFQ